MVEMLLTRPSPCLRLFRQPPSDSGDWKQAEFVIGDAPHCPPVIPRLPPAVGKLRTVLYQPFTATFLIWPVSETSRYRYTRIYRVISGSNGSRARFRRTGIQDAVLYCSYLEISRDMNSIGYSVLDSIAVSREIVKFRIFIACNISKLNRSHLRTIRIRISRKYNALNVKFLQTRNNTFKKSISPNQKILIFFSLTLRLISRRNQLDHSYPHKIFHVTLNCNYFPKVHRGEQRQLRNA